jgi:Ca2+-binding EF-hand superfamily protein
MILCNRLSVLALSLGILAAFGPGGVAAAEETGKGRFLERMFQKADADSDGFVTQAEARDLQRTMLARADEDGDGEISEAEFMAAKRSADEAAAAGKAERRQRRFAALDVDGNGRIDAAEQEQAAARRFARMDKNGDGKLTLDEMRAARPPR